MTIIPAVKPCTIKFKPSKKVLYFNSIIKPDKYKMRYFADSEFYQIRGGFTAELIKNPMIKFIKHEMINRVVSDLIPVTLSAFEKNNDKSEIYASKEIIMKNTIFTDYLTIIRDGDKIVAYSASSFLDKKKSILYFNATNVAKEYQNKGVLGSINHMYVVVKILNERKDYEGCSLTLVTRTRNKSVARLLDSVYLNMKVSGDASLSFKEKEFFNVVAEILKSPYDIKTGVNKNVYPSGLPNGSEKNDKIDKIFSKLDTGDAFFISGKPNFAKASILLKRQVKKLEALSTGTMDKLIGQLAA